MFLWEPTGETGDSDWQRLADPGIVGLQLARLLHVAWWRGRLCWGEAAHSTRWLLWWSWAIPQGVSGVENENPGLGGPPPSSPGLEQVMEPLSTRLSPPCLCTGHC